MSRVEILDWMGADRDAVTTFARQSTDTNEKGENAEDRLLAMLIRKGHTSCLSAIQLRVSVKCPIFVARQWLRHNVGWRYCERSLRYCKSTGEWVTVHNLMAQDHCHEAQWVYKYLLDEGFAGEDARSVLPLGTMTQFHAVVSMEALFHFFEKRLAPDAQHDIRELAEELFALCQEKFPKVMAQYDAYYRKQVPFRLHADVWNLIRRCLEHTDFDTQLSLLQSVGRTEQKEIREALTWTR